jgi:CHAT domain-containing protein
LESLTRHVSDCPDCRDQLNKRLVQTARIQDVRSSSTTYPGPSCLESEEWMRVAAGLVDTNTARQMLQHAAACDHCAPLLRTALEDFSDTTSSDEERLLGNLATTSPEGQNRLAARLSASNHGRQRVESRKASWNFSAWRWAAGAAVILITLILLTWKFQPRPESQVEDLIAKAYTEQRPFELRLANANHSPLRVERGRERSRFERPAALLQAEAIIGQKLKTQPTAPFWLQARARSELLEGNYETAIISLEQAIGPNDNIPSLHVDLGSAYYLRGLAEDRPSDYNKSVQQYSEALFKRPNDRVAIFNRALADEKLFLYDQAILDWQDFLRMEPTGGWAEEARQHLANLQQEIEKQKKNSSATSPADPNMMPEVVTDHEFEQLSGHIEQYLKLAETKWLPNSSALFDRARSTTIKPNAPKPLQVLAALARDEHGDYWLSDLLRAQRSPALSIALRDLAASINAEDQGDYLLALERSRVAKASFREAGSRAGELRASVEEVAALRLSDSVGQCLRMAESVGAELSTWRYPRLVSQLQLEHAICFDLIGDEGRAWSLAQAAGQTSGAAKYPTLSLRSVTLEAALAAATGQWETGWKKCQTGLRLYWSGNFPVMRRFSLLDAMEVMADGSHNWFAQFVVLSEAVTAIDADKDLMLRAVAHDQLAKCALRAGFAEVAQQQFRMAAQLFAMCPRNRVTESRQADEEIWLAQSETGLAKYESASARLTAIRQQVLSSPYRYGADHFYQAEGELDLKLGNLNDAESAFKSAVLLAERGLTSLKSERDRLQWNREHADVYRGLVDVQLRRQDIRGALDIWEWYKAAPLRGRAVKTLPGGTTGTAFDRMDKSSPLAGHTATQPISMSGSIITISFAFLPGSLVVWTYDATGTQMKSISGSPNEVERRVAAFTRACSNAASDEAAVHEEGRALFEILIAPIADRLTEKDAVVMEGDGAIAELPVQALVDRENRYFGDRFDIVWSQGSAYQRQLRSRQAISPMSPALAVAVPEADFVDGRVSLPDAVSEATSVAKRFYSSTLLISSDASALRVENELAKTVIFHFAGHATTGARGIGLVMARKSDGQRENEILSADSLTPAKLKHLQLAVLSACATEMGNGLGANDSDSLVRALVRAGVPDVLATRWNLDSHAASRFTTDFYDALLAGKTPARALREATTRLRAVTETAHPYYWAGLNIFGQV